MPSENSPQSWPKQEEEILRFWQEKKIFEKSIKQRPKDREFVFYDGPPFATGTPHYGHIIASVMKDTVPRYWTMKGWRVERRWGWDCHGLPIENIVEQELKIKSKKEIEEKVGVKKFNKICRSKVLMFVDKWKKFIPRIGRWVNMENAYKTMDLDYMESIWWAFKQLWDKGLVYEGYKSMHICPRCETTLSQSEVSEGYKDIYDWAVIVPFELAEEPASVLAWTTTPWTLIGNVALAVGADISYLKVKIDEHNFILAKNTAEKILAGRQYKILKEFKGKELAGKAYQPLFPYFDTSENRKNGFKIYAADFVATEEGTGVVHIAPAFGEDDLNLGKKFNLPFVQHVDASGKFIPAVKEWAGELVKPTDNPTAIDLKIIAWLKKNSKLFNQEKYIHSYPHCWRCETPLLNYATSSWFVKVAAVKERMLRLAKKIHWVPEYLKEGRFGKWLEGAEDWSVSRQRFWGSVLPIWRCVCGNIKVIGSIAELEKLSAKKITDLHKDAVDKIIFKCEKCGKEMQRIPDVLDCWFESGSMPYAQMHYPFENRELIDCTRDPSISSSLRSDSAQDDNPAACHFPAQFIAEGIDQTRTWFYYLLVLSTALMDEIPFENVIANGIVLAEDGQKMSKRLKNYPDPEDIVDKYGADALRYYLLTSPVIKAETLCFSEKGVDEAFKKLILILSNVLSFYQMYATDSNPPKPPLILRGEKSNILDRWILARLHLFIKTVTEQMDGYDLVSASRPIIGFVDDLSTWYLRRSRGRFKGDGEKDKKAALQTMGYVLLNLSKIMAPFTPFLAEKIYQAVAGKEESVHLEAWPAAGEIDKKLLDEMAQLRADVEKILALRSKNNIKVRQVLREAQVTRKYSPELLTILQEEVNVKKATVVGKLSTAEGWAEGEGVALDLKLDEQLRQEGWSRELVRQINTLRKEAGLTIKDKVEIFYQTTPGLTETITRFKEKILQETISVNIVDKKQSADFEKTLEIDGQQIWFGLKKYYQP